MAHANPATPGASNLFDTLMKGYGLKNDAALGRFLDLAPPVISKLRNGVLPVGPARILLIHEKTNMPVVAIREVLAGAA